MVVRPFLGLVLISGWVAPCSTDSPSKRPATADRSTIETDKVVSEPLADARPAKPVSAVAPDVAAPPSSACDTVEACEKVLRSETSQQALAAAGKTLATMGDPRALDVLGRFLGDPEFLERIDPTADSPYARTHVLSGVISALAQAPIPEVATLCLALGHDPDFLAIDERLIYLLRALAAVKPMTDEAVAFFAAQNPRGYAPSNAILLGRNASPNALALFETMLYAPGNDLENQMEMVRMSLLPVRTELEVIESLSRLLRRKNTAALEIVLVETLFDYQPAKWFRNPGPRYPKPPPWSDGSKAALAKALALAKRQRSNKRLPAELRRNVRETAKQIQAALAAK